MADHYDQLGEFADTDSCCRTHDHCPHVIHAFSSNYGHANFKWHSICHCDCDYALKSCLRKVNDSSSRVVGQAFFNVIGVPCFRFDYREQCAERHWYGMCKRYEQFPIAVLEEAVPYDFGGIDVIDELTVVPPKNKSTEEGKQDSSTQSTTTSTEEPSLTNVVTAAEDFIKVLATVSTSQSSSAESESHQGSKSERKKKKNSSKRKKTSKKPKTRGKGRKRKQKCGGNASREEGAAAAQLGSRAEEVQTQTNFISESQSHEHLPPNRPGHVTSNDVMKDEPARDRIEVPVVSVEDVQRVPEVLDSEKERLREPKSTIVNQQVVQISGPQRNRSRLGPPHEHPGGRTRRPEQQSSVELQTGVSISTFEVSPEAPRMKTAPPSTSPTAHHQIQEVSAQKVHTEQQTQHRLASRITTQKPSFSVLKSKQLKERTLRNRRRKVPALLLPLSTNSPSKHSDGVLILTLTPETSPTTTSTVTPPPGADWTTSTTAALTVAATLKLQRVRQRRKPWKPATGAALSREALKVTGEREPATPPAPILRKAPAPQGSGTPAAPAITPLQLSMEKLRAQLSRKKRRKAALRHTRRQRSVTQRGLCP